MRGEKQREALGKLDGASGNQGPWNELALVAHTQPHARSACMHMSLNWEAGENKCTYDSHEKENLLLALCFQFSCKEGKLK